MIEIQAPSRLHFGFFSLPSGEPGRRFGGAGLMVRQPGLRLTVSPAPEWSASGPLAERALNYARRFAQTLPTEELPPQHLLVRNAAPEHAGLGTGTQLGLAVARALAEAAGRPDMPVEELARRVGRGRRSALGIHGFARGGFLVEAGKGHPDALAPLVARAEFPEDWRVILVVPAQAQGFHGRQEVEAFTQLSRRPFPPAVTDTLCRLVLLGMLPALAERDLPAFGEAVFEFNARVGEMFASVQGGTYAAGPTAEVVAFLRRQNIRGVGQSSWGPAMFALVEDEGRARDVVELLRERPGLGREELFTARACNRGAAASVG